MVGRQRERRRLLDAFHQAVADRSCQLFTVLGTAGVGKSRLVAEVLETIDGAATVAAGRCLPYGDGLTWWPLAEALGEPDLLERAAADAERRRRARLRPARARRALPSRRRRHAGRCARCSRRLARPRPLVLVVDDLQWAEPTFVDVIEHVADWARDAPLLLLIMARPELLEARPGWGGGKPNATSVLLEPLAEAEAADLLRHLLGTARLGDRAAARILDVAEGNPLYVEEIVAMLADEGLSTRPTARCRSPCPRRSMRCSPRGSTVWGRRARGDRGGSRSRARSSRASGSRRSSASDARPVDGHLLALVRTDLIRPAGAGEGTFRFRHQLIRDAAYDGIPKDTRAVLHERFADWLEEHRPTSRPSTNCSATTSSAPCSSVASSARARRPRPALAARASASLARAGRRAAAREEPGSRAAAGARARPGFRRRARRRCWSTSPARSRATGSCCARRYRRRAACELARAAGDRRTATRARLAELSITMEHTADRHRHGRVRGGGQAADLRARAAR